MYCAAKYAHDHRREKTPRGIPWPVWFERKFGQNLFEYARHAREINLRDRFVTNPTEPKKTTD